jgi:anti-sigma regulatory factor (Ser/Thr protein kinase)
MICVMHLHAVRLSLHYWAQEACRPRHVASVGVRANVGKMADSAFLSWQFRGTAREGATGMSSMAIRASEAAKDFPMAESAVAGAAATDTAAGTAEAPVVAATVLGSLTIPGRPEHVREARGFVAKALGELHPSLENAVLLTSELVTNAVMHSASRCNGGTVTVQVRESAGGVRIEVADAGSDLSAPVVRGDVYASDGHGLFLVQTLSDQWGYLRDENGTTVWFWLGAITVPAE